MVQVSLKFVDEYGYLASTGHVIKFVGHPTDSYDMLPALLGIQNENESIRPHLLTQSFRGDFQIRQGNFLHAVFQALGFIFPIFNIFEPPFSIVDLSIIKYDREDAAVEITALGDLHQFEHAVGPYRGARDEGAGRRPLGAR